MFSSFFKGFIKTIPVLMGIIVGYVVAIPLASSTSTPSQAAAWIGLPTLTFPTFELGAILIIAPVALVVIVEHIGHLLVINEITGKDFTPMLPESLFGDGLATAISGAVGGTPVDHVRREHRRHGGHEGLRHPAVLVCGRVRVRHRRLRAEARRAISSIPTPVMGGISLLLFGLIASSGLRLLVKSGIDYSHSRNLIMSSVVLVIGIGMETGGFTIPLGNYTIPGMALATLVGVILNLILPKESEGLAVDAPDFVGDIRHSPPRSRPKAKRTSPRAACSTDGPGLRTARSGAAHSRSSESPRDPRESPRGFAQPYAYV